MNSYNILWVDDTWSLTEEDLHFADLSKIKRYLESKNSLIKFETRGSISDGITEIVSGNINYSLAIIDLVFENDQYQKTYKILISECKKRIIPFYIFSQYIDLVNLTQSAFSSDPLFIGYFVKNMDSGFCESILSISQMHSLNIIHLSDFHFNSLLEGKEREEQDDTFALLIKKISEISKLKTIDYIVFTGDFSAFDPRKDFIEGRNFFRQLVGKTINDFNKFLIVPGNHDLYWKDFENSIISERPLEPYMDFLNDLYSSNQEILKHLVGWNSSLDRVIFDNNPEGLSWARTFASYNLRILGLNTQILDKNFKGKGELKPSLLNFIQRQWSERKEQNEIRIAIMHHNILPPFSSNALERSIALINSGQVIEFLAKNKCDLVLSGHCHNSSIYNFIFSDLSSEGFTEFRTLTNISTGTLGGFSTTKDRAKTFNLISIFASGVDWRRKLIVQPYIYESYSKVWKELNPIDSKFGG